MKQIKSYVTPTVDVVEVQIEKGFATTGYINDVPMHGYYNDDNY